VVELKINFRFADSADLDSVANLIQSAYRGDYSKKGWTTEADLLGGLRTDSRELALILSDPASSLVLAFDSSLKGCMHLKREPNGSLYLGMFTVEPSCQGGGLGKALLLHAETLARQWNCHCIRMSVFDCRHELLAYYERRGYQKTGKRELFVGDQKFAIIKQGSLFFLELAKNLDFYSAP
jgi:GNAT superfamily N-acetyltransferase